MSEKGNLGDRLPRAEDAEIDPRKFEAYSMDRNNPANQGKWQGFVMLGYDVETPEGRQAAAQDVIQQLRRGLPNAPVTQNRSTPHGLRFELRVPIEGPNGVRANLFTAWQIDSGKDVPRLLTNWVEVYS